MKKSRRIDVKGLIRAILLKWPLLIAALLVFGAAGCGKYYRANHNVPAQQTSDNEKAAEIKSDNNKDYNQSQKEAIDREITWLNQFIDESPANKIDSYKAGYASTTLYIRGGNDQIVGTDDNEQSKGNSALANTVQDDVSTDARTNMVMESLQTFLSSDVDWSKEKSKYDVPEDAYLYDLMDIRVSGNTLTISVWYDTPENAKSILTDVVDQTEDEFNKLKNSESLNNISITETVSGSTTRIMTDGDNWVTQRINQLKNLASSIENSNAVKTADGSVSGSGGTAFQPVFSRKAMLKSGIKYGAAGFVLIAILLMIWNLYRQYVLSEEEFEVNTGIHTIGRIESDNQNLDIENLNETLKNRYSGKKIAVVSDLGENAVPESYKNTVALSKLLTDKNERDKLKEYDGALIFIHPYKSEYPRINEILNILDSRGLEIVGFVTLK